MSLGGIEGRQGFARRPREPKCARWVGHAWLSKTPPQFNERGRSSGGRCGGGSVRQTWLTTSLTRRRNLTRLKKPDRAKTKPDPVKKTTNWTWSKKKNNPAETKPDLANKKQSITIYSDSDWGGDTKSRHIGARHSRRWLHLHLNQT